MNKLLQEFREALAKETKPKKEEKPKEEK